MFGCGETVYLRRRESGVSGVEVKTFNSFFLLISFLSCFRFGVLSFIEEM